ncbi:hypothetical protein WDZ92_50415 [Nostoc sp. NIES-2111]
MPKTIAKQDWHIAQPILSLCGRRGRAPVTPAFCVVMERYPRWLRAFRTLPSRRSMKDSRHTQGWGAARRMPSQP